MQVIMAIDNCNQDTKRNQQIEWVFGPEVADEHIKRALFQLIEYFFIGLYTSPESGRLTIEVYPEAQ